MVNVDLNCQQKHVTTKLYALYLFCNKKVFQYNTMCDFYTKINGNNNEMQVYFTFRNNIYSRRKSTLPLFISLFQIAFLCKSSRIYYQISCINAWF